MVLGLHVSNKQKCLLGLMVTRTSLVAQTVKHLPAMREMGVQSLGREDPLEKEMDRTPVLLPGKSYGLRSLVG